jgi:hypothetical protein
VAARDLVEKPVDVTDFSTRECGDLPPVLVIDELRDGDRQESPAAENCAVA